MFKSSPAAQGRPEESACTYAYGEHHRGEIGLLAAICGPLAQSVRAEDS
jgi:hypothetical protein